MGDLAVIKYYLGQLHYNVVVVVLQERSQHLSEVFLVVLDPLDGHVLHSCKYFQLVFRVLLVSLLDEPLYSLLVFFHIVEEIHIVFGHFNYCLFARVVGQTKEAEKTSELRFYFWLPVLTLEIPSL